jgi:hypothetical protein
MSSVGFCWRYTMSRPAWTLKAGAFKNHILLISLIIILLYF